MSGGTGEQIAAVDYTSIRNKIIKVLGTGTRQYGYGQPIASSAVFSENIIYKAQWDGLRLDLLNIKLHQDGVYPSIVTLSPDAVIRYGAGHPNFNYDSLADQATTEKFNIGAGQSVLSSAASQTYSSAWGVQAQCTLTVTFAGGYTVTNADSSTFTASSADHARHFFNSGGKLRFTSSRTGGSSTSQNNAWTNLLNTTVGTIQFGAQTPEIINFYSLTTSYQQIYQISSSTPYSANFYRIEALCDCTDATNVNGTAGSITFRITWRDDYADIDPLSAPYDSVDGTLRIDVEELKATGTMYKIGDSPDTPTGTFTIVSPTYSISSISAS